MATRAKRVVISVQTTREPERRSRADRAGEFCLDLSLGEARIAVRIELDPEPLKKHPLRVGLSMVSSVDPTDTSGPVLTTVARAKPVMATRVYAAELDDVSARVADLIAANAGGQG